MSARLVSSHVSGEAVSAVHCPSTGGSGSGAGSVIFLSSLQAVMNAMSIDNHKRDKKVEMFIHNDDVLKTISVVS